MHLSDKLTTANTAIYMTMMAVIVWTNADSTLTVWYMVQLRMVHSPSPSAWFPTERHKNHAEEAVFKDFEPLPSHQQMTLDFTNIEKQAVFQKHRWTSCLYSKDKHLNEPKLADFSHFKE